MRRIITSIAVLFLCFKVSSQIININPDTNGDPWWVFETSPITPEIQATINNIPLLTLSDTSQNTPLLSVIDNSKKIYMRSVFQQEDGCCAQASGIGYTYTYEINRIRNLPSDTTDNRYPTHFTYNIVRSYPKQGSLYSLGWDLLKYAGCPNVTEYGGMYHYYPPLTDKWRSRVWESDYELYKNSLPNRVKDYYRIDATTEEGLNILKHWLNDHNEGDTVGGLACFSTYMGSETIWTAIDSTTKIATALDDTSGYHAMTIVGYNDTIGWDFNGDSVISNIDNNGDTLNMNEWELGSLKIVNSWGEGWSGGYKGYAYIPYRFLADTNYSGFASKMKAIMVVNAEDNNDDMLLLKTSVSHSHRDSLRFITGYAKCASDTVPFAEQTIGIFDHQGGAYPMQSRFLNDTTPLECALDFGQFYINNDFGKIYFIINEKDVGNVCDGRIVSYSIVDYRWHEEFELSCELYDVPLTNNSRTYLSINYDLIPHEYPITTTDTLFSDMVCRFNPVVDSNATLLVEKGVNIDMYGSELTISEGSTLTLEDSVTITAKRNNCSIVIDGDFHIGKHINFIADSGAILEIWLNNKLLQTTFDSIYFENCQLHNAGKEFTVSNSEFVDCEKMYSTFGKIMVSNSNFTRTGLHITNNDENNFLSTITGCNISSNSTGNDAAILLFNCDRFFITYDIISNFHAGCELYYCGEGTSGNQTIMGNQINGCTAAGISSFSTRASIAGNNIYGNKKGIVLYNSCNTDIIGDAGALTNEETQQISNNTSYELYASANSFPWYFRYNVIHDSDNGGNPTDPIIYYEPEDDVQFPDTLDVKYNCWDSKFVDTTDLYPPGLYTYEPTWCPGKKSSAVQQSEPLYLTARDQFDNALYTQAQSTFEQVVEQYPQTKYAIAAMKDLFDIEQFVNNDYYTLQDYYLTNTIIVSDSALRKLGIFLANECNLKNENWQLAIDHYENIINNPPSVDDSIFAIIDLGHTYLLMENSTGRSIAMGQMTQHMPASTKDYEANSNYLLELLPFTKTNSQLSDNESTTTIENKNRLLQSIPNPTSGITEISFYLDNQLGGRISIINNLGSKVKTYSYTGVEGKNIISVDMGSLPPGIYYYTLEINNIIVDVKKMVVVR